MAAETMYVTVAGAGGKTGADWANAMGLAEFSTDVINSCEAGDIYYLLSGTYALTAHISTARDGSTSNYIKVIGVSDEALTEASGASRPVINTGIYRFEVDNYWYFRNLSFTGASTSVNVFKADNYTWAINCKCESTVNNIPAANIDSGFIINCDFISALGYSLIGSGNLDGCYIKNGYNISLPRAGMFFIINSIFDGGAVGINFAPSTQDYQIIHIRGCTIYGCTIGIDLTDALAANIRSNIIDTCTTGIDADATSESYILDYNNFNGNTADVSNVTKGANATALDPQFVNAAGGNFAIQQPLLKGVGFRPSFNGTSTSYVDTGAVQTQEVVAALPTFAGITQLEAVGGGCLRASWAAGSGTITTYNVYIKEDNDTALFTSTYLKMKIDSSSTEAIFRTDWTNEDFLNSTKTYYVGIRAENSGTEETNTESLSVVIQGDGHTYLNMNDIITLP